MQPYNELRDDKLPGQTKHAFISQYLNLKNM